MERDSVRDSELRDRSLYCLRPEPGAHRQHGAPGRFLEWSRAGCPTCAEDGCTESNFYSSPLAGGWGNGLCADARSLRAASLLAAITPRIRSVQAAERRRKKGGISSNLRQRGGRLREIYRTAVVANFLTMASNS